MVLGLVFCFLGWVFFVLFFGFLLGFFCLVGFWLVPHSQYDLYTKASVFKRDLKMKEVV